MRLSVRRSFDTTALAVQGDRRGYDWPPPRGRDLRTSWDASWRGGRLPPPPQRHLAGRDAQESPPHMRGPGSGSREVIYLLSLPESLW